MSHIHPEPVEGRLLYDGCPECEQRAASVHGLHHLDPQRINALWDKMQALEFSKQPLDPPLNRTEMNACRVLHEVGVLLEHFSAGNMIHARPALHFDPELFERSQDDSP